MQISVRVRLLARAVALVLLATAIAPRVARALLGADLSLLARPDMVTLRVTVAPYGGTYYAASRPVRIGWCDTFTGQRRVKWNNVTVTGVTYLNGSDPDCDGAYKYSDLTLTMGVGSNTLWVEGCDASLTCDSDTIVFTYLTSDQTTPTAQISGTPSEATVIPTITWCDGNTLGTGREVLFNGVNVTASFPLTTQPGDTGTPCNTRATSTGTLTLRSGINTLTARIQDSAGNWGPVPAASATWTYHPLIDTSPTNQFSVVPLMFDAMLSYSMPTYRSLDQDRAVTLVYSSQRARPNAFVYMDVTDNSSQPADTMSIGLLWNGVFQTRPDGQTTTHYRTQAGTNRLGAFYGASNSPTRSMDMKAVVKRFWTGGSAEDTVPVRVLVINEKDSPYGAGWTVAGVERVVTGNGGDPGIIVVHGDASGTFYPAYTSCNASKVCTFGHSPGEFGTMVYDSLNARYVRTGRDGMTSSFNAAGQLTEVRDRLNNVQSFTYSNGRLSTILDPAGKLTTFAYDAAGKLASITDPTGRTSTVVVNAAGDLASITGPDQVMTMQMTYGTNHRVLSYTDRGGRVSNITYDVWGRVASTQSPAFTAEGGQTFRLTTTLTSLEMAVQQGNTNGGTHAAPFPRVDPATLRVSVVDPEGRTTSFALDPWGAPSRVEDYLGYVSTTTRNAEGQVTSSADAKGNATTYGWTGGDLTGVTDATGTVGMAYDAAGRVTDVTSPTGTVKNVYGATTELLDSTVVSGTDTTRYTYDTIGRMLTVSDPEHHITTYGYTDTSQWQWKNTRSVASGGRTSSFRYDAYGRLAGTTDPAGHETTVQYDLLNRQRFVTTPDAGVTEYVWGSLFMDRVNDPRGQSYLWTRNSLGLVEREVHPGDPAGVNLTAAYDRYGRTTSSTDRRGRQVSVTYDAQDRVVTRTADGQTTTFGFSPDQPANPTAPSWFAFSNAESTDTVSVDGRGRVTSSISRRALAGGIVQRFELQPRYDAYERPVGLVVLQPGGVRDSLGYSYSPSTALLQSMRDMAGGSTTFAYNRDGLPTTSTLPNSHAITYGYTSLHLPRSIRYGILGVDNAAGMQYEYDLLDRAQSWIRPNYSRDREFAYDQNGGWLAAYSDYQQSGSSHPTCTPDANNGIVCSDPSATMTLTGSDAFGYDLTGNPTDHGAVLGVANRLAQYNGYTLAYDSTGNLISKTKTGFSQTFAWNALGQLTSVTTNGSTVSYGYDGMGKRVRQRINGVDEGYLYDGENLLLEYNGNGVQAKYTYYPGSGRPHSVSRGGQTYYYGSDVQGSVLAMFNSVNTVVNTYGYLPFGETQTATETVANRLRFAGRELEGQTGLYYNNARWYDPQLHRFISEDPIGIAGGLNLYAYTGNDPVNASDPSGLLTCTKKNPGVTIGELPHGGGSVNGSSPYWECDWWGMPPANFADLRTEYGSICAWHWHCPGDQDPWAETGSCRMEGCELRPARPEERQMVVKRLMTINRSDPFCRKVTAAGLAMAKRQLGIFDNNVSYMDQGVMQYIWGNAPFNTRLGGPVLYLYSRRMRFGDGLNVVHEAVHGLRDPMRSIPSYYSDYSTTEIGLSVDASALYCMKGGK
jgi:RHS repeat-associated protein